MKPTVNERLNEVLGIEVSEATTEIVPRQPAEIVSSGNPDKDMQDDYEYARNGLRNLVEKGNELVDNANFLAKEKQDSRSTEAAAMAQKEQRENLVSLINLHKTRKEIERVSSTSPGGGDTNITQNAVFVGTTGELLKLTREMNADGLLKDALKTITVQPEVTALNSGAESEK